MKILGIFLALFIGLPLIGLALGWISIPFNTAQKQLEIVNQAQNKVLNADNAIYNYEWFKQKYQDIEASKRNYKLAKVNYDSYVSSLGDRTTWGFEDKNEVARLNTVVLGIQTNLEGQIGDYNARASMATRNIFEDGILPSYIDALTFVFQN